MSEGLGVLGDDNNWTLPGLGAKGVQFTSLDSGFDSTSLHEETALETHGTAYVHETAHATYWRQFSHAANALRDHDPSKSFLVALGNCGYLYRAAKETRTPIMVAQRWLDGFCKDHGIDRSRLGMAADRSWELEGTDPSPSAVRHLTKKEIKALEYTPPIRRGNSK